jgi:hypothetical protein
MNGGRDRAHDHLPEIRAGLRVEIERLARQLLGEPLRAGRNGQMLFYDWPTCFGCQAHGDAIGYVRQRDGLDFRSAVAALAPPVRPWIDGKAVVTDEAGKVRYQPLITFSTHGCRSRWSDAVLDAVREVFPDALADTTDEPSLAFPDDAP